MGHSSIDIIPQPFAWKPVSAGNVKVISINSKEGDRSNYIPMGTSEVFNVSAFEMAKYPLTNAQFSKFIDAKGYSQRQWWTDEGWEARTQGLTVPLWDGSTPESPKVEATGTPWTEPLYWQESRWNRPDYPVVGVSWYEAVAFCQWLGHVTGERISLPTEQQWQHAAQGDTDNLFAWGSSFPDDLYDYFNWNAERLDPNPTWDSQVDTEGTTPVTRYEGKGDSPFGVVDINGNVWEWSLTSFATGKNDLDGTDGRIVKGGGWVLMYSYEINYGNTDRMSLWPYHRLDYVGFRLIRT